jgi:hypothetical protein
VRVFAPLTVRVASAPVAFVTVPPNARLLVPLRVIMRGVAPKVTAPAPNVKLFVPPKVKLPPQVIALVVVSVIAPPKLVLSIVPPFIAKLLASKSRTAIDI